MANKEQFNFAVPKAQQERAVRAEHFRTCKHCKSGRVCPVGRYYNRKERTDIHGNPMPYY